MAEGKIHLKIITTSKQIFEDDVDAIYTQGENGSFGILYNHTPFMSALKIGVTKVVKDGVATFFTTMGGAFQVKNNDAIILTPEAELGSDIDVLRANEAKERAEARIAAQQEGLDFDRAQIALAKAIARISAAEKM